MAINYASMRGSFEGMIAENGRTVTLSRRNAGHADVNKPWRAGTSPDTVVSVSAVLVPYTAQEVDERLVKAEDQRMYVVADGVNAFEDFDTVVDGADTWRIVRTTKYGPGAIVVAYEMQLRR